MRKRKNNKQVLIPRNNYNSNQRYKRNKGFSPIQARENRYRRKNQRKNNGMLVFLMIIALIGFVLGAGVGVSLNLEDTSDDDAPAIVNVTKEMIKDVNVTDEVSYDYTEDTVDYNENQTSEENVSYV